MGAYCEELIEILIQYIYNATIFHNMSGVPRLDSLKQHRWNHFYDPVSFQREDRVLL